MDEVDRGVRNGVQDHRLRRGRVDAARSNIRRDQDLDAAQTALAGLGFLRVFLLLLCELRGGRGAGESGEGGVGVAVGRVARKGGGVDALALQVRGDFVGLLALVDEDEDALVGGGGDVAVAVGFLA